MPDTLENLEAMLADLKRQRSDLQAKLPADNEDMLDEWSQLETLWEEIERKMDIVREEISDRTETVAIALSLSLHEMKNCYAKLRDELPADS